MPTDRELADRSAAAYALGVARHPGLPDRGAIEQSAGILRRSTGLPVPYFNWLYVVDDAVDEAALAGAIAWFDDRGQPFTARIREHQVQRYARVLRGLGLAPEIVMPGMVAAPVPSPRVRLDVDGLDVVPVKDQRTYLDFTARVAPGAPGDWLTTELYRELMPPGIGRDADATYLVGYVDGRSVANAAARLDDGVLVVFAVGTADELRGRGIGTALTAAALDWGRANGADLAFLTSSDMARGMYERMGFRQVDTWHFYLRPWSQP